jgi:riboflavin synthase
MFTGIIEGMGTICGVRPAGSGKRLIVEADFALEGSKIGDSIAVSGACLTAVRIHGRRFEADLSPETLTKSTFDGARVGDRVNLERAMRLSDRLDGHLVLGHIDGVGVFRGRETTGNSLKVTIDVPPALTRYMILKGSLAVDGISLTLNAVAKDRVSVTVIPHTAAVTTVGLKAPGARVNLEVDLIGKYVERFLFGNAAGQNGPPAGGGGIDMGLLARTGFLK